MLLYKFPDLGQVALRQAVIPGKLNSRLDPEFRLSIFAMRVNMHARLLKGEEVKSEPAFPEYGGTHEMPSIKQNRVTS
jgi:hypothetical protein